LCRRQARDKFRWGAALEAATRSGLVIGFRGVGMVVVWSKGGPRVKRGAKYGFREDLDDYLD